MNPKTIDQFLFPYQRSFAASVRHTAKQVFERIGLDVAPDVLMVGVAWPPLPDRHRVCVEPEDGPWPQSIFSSVTPERLEAAWRDHPMQRMFYGDEPAMRDKPENVRRLVVSELVKDSLDAPSRAKGMRSFVSTARPLEGYYVTVVLQVPERTLSGFPPVAYTWLNERSEESFLTACIRAVLRHAERALTLPEPGRFTYDDMGSAEEIVRQAGRSFMRIPFLPGEIGHSDLFDEFNAISRLMYEGAKGRGRMILAQPDDPTVSHVLRLADPVPLRRTRWARKLLQMGSGEQSLIISSQAIHGLGSVSGVGQPSYSVDFLDQQQWEFRRGREVLIRTRFGDPMLPREPIGEARFLDNFQRIFPEAGERAAARFRDFLHMLLDLPRGCMMVVADDAASEAVRLHQQGTRIEPTALTGELIDRASRIDGTILVDPRGMCHAIGVILDGDASDGCTPSRGARFNSAMRYVTSGQVRRLAFVISEDRTLDVIPLLRAQMSAKALEAMVVALEGATVDNFHVPRTQLDDHRFYLDADQCARVNAALAPLNDCAREEGQLVWLLSPFVPDPEMNAGYLTA